MMFHRCSLVINKYEYHLDFQFTLYPIMERIFGPIVVARITGVVSIPHKLSIHSHVDWICSLVDFKLCIRYKECFICCSQTTSFRGQFSC
ncbi:hypothetical protein Lser_V15G45451 [Lactuca serriola]